MSSPDISQEQKEQLTALYQSLNPAQITRNIRKAQAELHARKVTSLLEATKTPK
jgi:hypothetical protein